MVSKKVTADSIIVRAAALREFVKGSVIPFETDSRNSDHGPTEDLVAELRELSRKAGFLTPQIACGGKWLSHKDIAALFRAAGYSPLGPVALNCMAPDEGNMVLLEKIASPEQKARFLPELLSGRTRSAFLMTEPDGGAGSDPSMMLTTARRRGNQWLINGEKTFITGAEGAGLCIIVAKTENGATLFLLDMASPGISIERIINTLDSSMPGGHAVVRLRNVEAGQDAVLGEVDHGFEYAQVRLAPARLTHCMRWWGAAERAHDIATAYACKRKAFGKVLIEHEGIGFMLADNLIDLKQSELIIDWCASRLDEGERCLRESSMTKVAVSEALYRIADRCVQAMGALGLSKDTVVEQIFREIRAFRIYDGPSEVHRWSLAKSIRRRSGVA